MGEHLLLILWFLTCSILVGSSGSYYLYTRKKAGKPWRLSIDKEYRPSIAVLVAVHNEEKTIKLKLKNLSKVDYPNQKIETIIVNDASTDNTLREIERYTALETSHKTSVFNRHEHLGKTNCLNHALSSVTAEIVVISDADCFWPRNILLQALPYLSDQSVGAITARELILNPQSSWVTLGEQFFDGTVQTMRTGESKIHSTIFFQGGFAAYKRVLLEKFDQGADDSGTALDVVQNNKRTLLIPEIGFYTPFPTKWTSKLTLKIRRARQLQCLWLRCFKLLIHRKLKLPKRIALSQLFLHVASPLLFLSLTLVSVFAFMQWPLFLVFILAILCPISLIKKTRIAFVEVTQNYVILLAALASLLVKRRFRLWTTVQESRLFITEDILREKNLI